MIAARRWQDWAVVLVGLLTAASPLVYGWGGTAGQFWVAGTAAAWSALVLGGLLALVGAAALLVPREPGLTMAEVILAVLLFFAPWLVGYTEATWFAWTSWTAAVVVAAIVGTEFAVPGTRRAA